jgi:hypothetical protein
MTEDSRPSKKPEIWDVPTDPAEPAQPAQPAAAAADYVTAYVQGLQPSSAPAPYVEPHHRRPGATGQQPLFGGVAALRAAIPPGSEKTIIGVAPAPSVIHGEEGDDTHDDDHPDDDHHDDAATVLAPRLAPSRASEPTMLAAPVRGSDSSHPRPSEPTILAAPRTSDPMLAGPVPPAPATPAAPAAPAARSRADEATVLAAPIARTPQPNGAVPVFPPRQLAGSAPVAAPKFPPLRPVPAVPAFRPQPSSYPRPIARAETEVGETSRRRTWIVLVLLAAMIGLAAVLAYVQLEL